MAWYDVLDPADVFGLQQEGRIGRANDAIADAQKKAESTSDANRVLNNQFYNEAKNTYGDTAAKLDAYLGNLEGMDVYDPGQFEYTGDVNDFYSKAADLRQKNAMNSLRESSDIFSSDYQDAMAAKQQAMASEEWDKAYERYMRDRSQNANEWQMNANVGQQVYQNNYNKNKDLFGIAQNAQDTIMNAYGNFINNTIDQNNIDTQNHANSIQQIAANENSRKGLIGRILG